MEVYDEVWTMKDNKPTKMYIYSKTASMGHMPDDIDFSYTIVREFCSKNTSINPSIGCNPDNLFYSLAELIASLGE